ncbi:MAG TPA: hypothetical protein VJ464_13890 [Blastocatellia bacterium]|nr:hypothetical protein [Blastocatellia bacterium]
MVKLFRRDSVGRASKDVIAGFAKNERYVRDDEPLTDELAIADSRVTSHSFFLKGIVNTGPESVA